VLKAFAVECSDPERWRCRGSRGSCCLRPGLHRCGCEFCVIRLHKLAAAAVHVTIHLPTHLRSPVSGVELIDTVQLAIAIVHDASGLSLPIFEGVLTSEIVTQFMSKNKPGFLQFGELCHSCVIATLVAHATTPGNANGAIAIATTSEEMQSSHEWMRPVICLQVIKHGLFVLAGAGEARCSIHGRVELHISDL